MAMALPLAKSAKNYLEQSSLSAQGYVLVSVSILMPRLSLIHCLLQP